MLRTLSISVFVILFTLLGQPPANAQIAPISSIVLQTDFGVADGARAALVGVIDQVDPRIKVNDLTHEIPPFDIWAAAFRLGQASFVWQAGTVFVSVVDPGVGTDRRSVVVRTNKDHYLVTPDNGTLTLIDELEGIAEARIIDPALRLPGSENSHTFHGRDVYAFVAAKLASGQLAFENVGSLLPTTELIRLPQPAARIEGDVLRGWVPALDVRYGNVWSNIPLALAHEFGFAFGNRYHVRILHQGSIVFQDTLPFEVSFGKVPPKSSLLYGNSLGKLACGANLANFASDKGVRSGQGWSFEIRKTQ